MVVTRDYVKILQSQPIALSVSRFKGDGRHLCIGINVNIGRQPRLRECVDRLSRVLTQPQTVNQVVDSQ